jgi:hypothetical protein
MSYSPLCYVHTPVTLGTWNEMFTLKITSGEEEHHFILTRHAFTVLIGKGQLQLKKANAKAAASEMNVIGLKPKSSRRRPNA